jgi:hypothetical protein
MLLTKNNNALKNLPVGGYVIPSPVEFIKTEFLMISGRYMASSPSDSEDLDSKKCSTAMWCFSSMHEAYRLIHSAPDDKHEATKWMAQHSLDENCVFADITGSNIAIGGYNKMVALSFQAFVLVVYSNNRWYNSDGTGEGAVTVNFDAAFSEED